MTNAERLSQRPFAQLSDEEFENALRLAFLARLEHELELFRLTCNRSTLEARQHALATLRGVEKHDRACREAIATLEAHLIMAADAHPDDETLPGVEVTGPAA